VKSVVVDLLANGPIVMSIPSVWKLRPECDCGATATAFSTGVPPGVTFFASTVVETRGSNTVIVINVSLLSLSVLSSVSAVMMRMGGVVGSSTGFTNFNVEAEKGADPV